MRYRELFFCWCVVIFKLDCKNVIMFIFIIKDAVHFYKECQVNENSAPIKLLY